MQYKGIIDRYGEFLDLPADITPVTLCEGNTPLIPVPAIAAALGGGFELYVKYEGLNPTGSFKDRGMSAAVTMAVYNKKKTIMCASTGNTAASAAAYANRAGLRSIVMIPEGKVALGKLAGAIAYQAEVIQIPGSFDDAFAFVIEICQKSEIELVNSLNPYRLEGQKSGAFEICDSLGNAPDWLCIPVGNAGNISAYWMGFNQYNSTKKTGLPQILGVQAEGSAPLVVGHSVDNPETIATAIRIGNPARGEQALSVAEESKGSIIAVSDQKILEAQKMLTKSGIWVEPASAAGLAGLKDEVESGKLDPKGKQIVLICTGHGMKDPDIITSNGVKPTLLPLDYNKVAEYILGGNPQ